MGKQLFTVISHIILGNTNETDPAPYRGHQSIRLLQNEPRPYCRQRCSRPPQGLMKVRSGASTGSVQVLHILKHHRDCPQYCLICRRGRACWWYTNYINCSSVLNMNQGPRSSQWCQSSDTTAHPRQILSYNYRQDHCRRVPDNFHGGPLTSRLMRITRGFAVTSSALPVQQPWVR